jgi:Ca2+-transporting ATPase
MVLVLVAAAVASAAVQEYKGTVTLAIVIVVNTVIGFIQEYKAEKALSGLMSLEVPRGSHMSVSHFCVSHSLTRIAATVIRDGIVEELPAADLVPGDLVTLDEGNSVPADLRMVEAINLEILEAVLTGESDSVHKHVDHIPLKNLPVGDRKNMAFMSTTVVKGRGTGLVVTIGTKTEAGKISESLAKAKQPVTPLQRRLSILGRWLVFIAVFLALLIIAIGLIRNRDAREMVLLGVSLGFVFKQQALVAFAFLLTSLAFSRFPLSVSVIPEGLATVCIVTMALGVRRMAKKNAIVRQLAAVGSSPAVPSVVSF